MSTTHPLKTLGDIFTHFLDNRAKAALSDDLRRLEQGASPDTLGQTAQVLLKLADRMPAGLIARFTAEACTLADAVQVVDIARAAGFKVTGLERCVADARRLAKHLFKSTAGLASLPVARGALFQRIGAAEIGMTPKSFASFRSRILRLARILDRRFAKVVLPQEWADLVAAARSAGHGHHIARSYCLIRTASRLTLSPSAVDQLLVTTVLEEAIERGIAKPYEMIARACEGWNALTQAFPDWPDIMLSAPPRPDAPKSHRRFFKDLPEEVQALWEAFEDRHRRDKGFALTSRPQATPSDENRFLAVIDQELEESVPRYAPVTLKGYRGVWLQLAHMALEDDASVKSVGDVISLDRCSRLLHQIETAQIVRASQRGEDHLERNAHLCSKTSAMIALARATNHDSEVVAGLLRMRAAVDPMVERVVRDSQTGHMRSIYKKSRRRTGPRHRKVIDQFEGDGADAVKAAFFRMPDRLLAPILPRIRGGLALTRTEPVDAIVALTCRILMECPMRRANIAYSLRISGDRQTLFVPNAQRRLARLHIPAAETKTEGRDVVAEFSPQTTDLLKLFIRSVRPQLAQRVGADPSNCWLFPGEGPLPRSAWSVSTKIKDRAAKVAGITINPHAFRHVIGLLILEQDPTQLPVVSTVLGHTSLRTTTDWYADVPQKEAQAVYLNKLSSAAQKAVLTGGKGKRGRR